MPFGWRRSCYRPDRIVKRFFLIPRCENAHRTPGEGGRILRGFEESGPSIPPGAEKLLGVLFDSDREIQVPGDPVRSGGALLSETEAGAGPDAGRGGYQQFLLLAASLNGDRLLGAVARLVGGDRDGGEEIGALRGDPVASKEGGDKPLQCPSSRLKEASGEGGAVRSFTRDRIRLGRVSAERSGKSEAAGAHHEDAAEGDP